MSFENALKKLEDAVDDLTTLTVRTFGGKLESIVNLTGADFEKALQKAQTEGVLALKMRTEIKLDSDTDLFVADGVDAATREMHAAAVQAALTARQAIVDLAARTVRGKA